MKWNELSIRDKTQLYKRIKQQNPQATWFDLKTQFDAIPQFEDGEEGDRHNADVDARPEAYRSVVQKANRLNDRMTRRATEIDEYWNKKDLKYPKYNTNEEDFNIRPGQFASKGHSPMVFSDTISYTPKENPTDALGKFANSMSAITERNAKFQKDLNKGLQEAAQKQEEARIEKWKETKRNIEVGLLAAQMLTGGGAIAATEKGALTLAKNLNRFNDVANAVQFGNSIYNKDYKDAAVNALPLISRGASRLIKFDKIGSRLNQRVVNDIQDFDKNFNPLFDIGVNPFWYAIHNETNN